MNEKTKWGHWFWGLFFLACAGILVASKMGRFSYHIGFWMLVLTLILVAATIKSIVYFSVSGTVFSLAFLSLLYAKPLGITSLVPWTILGAALLLSIGLSLVLQPFKRKLSRHHAHITFEKTGNYTGQHFSDTTSTDYESYVEVNVRMGSTIRYVQSDNFQQAVINVTMGDVSLYIPKEWDVQMNLNSIMADLGEKGLTPTKTGPKVFITGNFKLGDIEVYYV